MKVESWLGGGLNQPPACADSVSSGSGQLAAVRRRTRGIAPNPRRPEREADQGRGNARCGQTGRPEKHRLRGWRPMSRLHRSYDCMLPPPPPLEYDKCAGHFPRCRRGDSKRSCCHISRGPFEGIEMRYTISSGGRRPAGDGDMDHR